MGDRSLPTLITGYEPPNAWWKSHPYNPANNINGVNGGNDEGFACHTLSNAAITALQDAYVLKVIDTVKDLDNVLFEIANEAFGPDNPPYDSTAWQNHMIKLIKSTENGLSATFPPGKIHPVGMTGLFYLNSNDELTQNGADWISPRWDDSILQQPDGPYNSNMPEADGDQVVILDTDHIGGPYESTTGYAARKWVWESFTRGYSCIYMDELDEDPILGGAKKVLNFYPFDYTPHAPEVRDAMGDTRFYADRMNLIEMTPQRTLSSTNYVLAKVGEEYLVYQPAKYNSMPAGNYFTVYLLANTYNLEWFDPKTGAFVDEGASDFLADDDYAFTPPPPNFDTGAWTDDAVLYISMYQPPHPTSRPRH